MEMERGAWPSCRRFAAGPRPSGRLALGLVLIVVTAACHGQPSQRPMKAGPVDTGAGSFYGLSGGSAPLARPNLVGDPFSNVPTGYYFNPFAFARPFVAAGAAIPSSNGTATAGALGTDIGNVTRNILRGPHQNNTDFSIIKRFNITEGKSLEFRGEFFNLFNSVNFANPISDLNAVAAASFNADGTIKAGAAGRFGQIISASNNPRLVQFGFKFNF